MVPENRHVRVPQQRRSKEKRAQIVQAAYAVFGERGYHNVTTVDIARASGLSTGTLYSYFADKKQIFLEALGFYFARMQEKFAADLRAISARDATADIIDKLLTALIDDNRDHLAFHKELLSLIYIDADVHRAYLANHDALIDIGLADMGAWGVRASRSQILMLITMLEGISREINYNPASRENRDEYRAICARFAAMLFVRGE